MEEQSQALLALDRLYTQGVSNVYEQAREKLKVLIESLLPGFTIAHAIEIGTRKTYRHREVVHTLLPCVEIRRENIFCCVSGKLPEDEVRSWYPLNSQA